MDNEGDSDPKPIVNPAVTVIQLRKKPLSTPTLRDDRDSYSAPHRFIHDLRNWWSKISDEKHYSVHPQHLAHYASTVYGFCDRLDLLLRTIRIGTKPRLQVKPQEN